MFSTNNEITKDLTLKQRKWLRVYLETGNATEAAVQIYDCKDRESAATIGWENLRKLDFSDLLEDSGITDKYLSIKLKEGLEATKRINIALSSYNGSTQNDENQSVIEIPDYLVRHKYLETTLKLKKRLDQGKSGQEIQDRAVLVIPSEIIEKYGIPTQSPL